MCGWLRWGLVMHCQWVWRLVAAWGALWDWLKVFRVGGAACGGSVGIGNPWQTLPLLLSSLMESEESLEVASVNSTCPQNRHMKLRRSFAAASHPSPLGPLPHGHVTSSECLCHRHCHMYTEEVWWGHYQQPIVNNWNKKWTALVAMGRQSVLVALTDYVTSNWNPSF